MEIKINAAGLKQLNEKGEGIAIIATLNVVDKDNDVTRPGAFGDQTVPMVSAHQWQKAPIGKARVHELDNEVLASFHLNLKNSLGKDWHESLKFDLDHPPAKQQYSYGFSIKKGGSETGDFEGSEVRFLKALEVHEVSPVLLGAGVDTRTLAIKGNGKEDKRATPKHKTETNDGAWSGPANERRVKVGEGLPYYRSIYAWQDPSKDSETKAAWKFIHHFVSSTGDPGAASVRAAITGVAVLNGARGGTTIPDADRRGLWNHLGGHLEDADREPPELRSYDNMGIKIADQILLATWDLELLIERMGEIREMRAREGRSLTDQRIEEISDLKNLVNQLDTLICRDLSDPRVGELILKYYRLRQKGLDLESKNLLT